MRIPIGLVIASLLAACDRGPTAADQALEQTTQLTAQVAELSDRLSTLEKELQQVREVAELPEHERMRRFHERQMAAQRPKPVEQPKLAEIKLPEDPTHEQIQQYVRAILASTGHVSPSPHEPHVQMLTRIGSSNLEILLDELAGTAIRPGTSPHFLQRAIESLVGPQHKQLILDRLVTQPSLITVVEKMGWVDDARPLLIEGLKRRPANLPSQWITYIAKLEDPKTYEALKEAMIQSPQPATVYDAIRDLPGIDLDEAVRQTWKRLQHRIGNDSAKAGFVTIAIAHGDKDALGAFIDIIDVNDTFDLHHKGWAFLDRTISPRRVVLKHIDFHGSDAEITVWYEKNYHDLAFDKSRRVFYLPEPADDAPEVKAGE